MVVAWYEKAKKWSNVSTFGKILFDRESLSDGPKNLEKKFFKNSQKPLKVDFSPQKSQKVLKSLQMSSKSPQKSPKYSKVSKVSKSPQKSLKMS